MWFLQIILCKKQFYFSFVFHTGDWKVVCESLHNYVLDQLPGREVDKAPLISRYDTVRKLTVYGCEALYRNVLYVVKFPLVAQEYNCMMVPLGNLLKRAHVVFKSFGWHSGMQHVHMRNQRNDKKKVHFGEK